MKDKIIYAITIMMIVFMTISTMGYWGERIRKPETEKIGTVIDTVEIINDFYDLKIYVNVLVIDSVVDNMVFYTVKYILVKEVL